MDKPLASKECLRSLPAPPLLASNRIEPAAVLSKADLGLTARALPDTAGVGGVVRYLAMVTNFGPDSAMDVTVGVTLPACLAYQGNSCGAPAPAAGVWSWSLGTLAPNATSRIRPRCLITFQATAAGVQNIIGMVATTSSDPEQANDTVVTPVSVN